MEVTPSEPFESGIAIVASIGSQAPVIGPFLGDWITEGMSWRWISFNFPAVILILAPI